jgi:adenylate cyclase
MLQKLKQLLWQSRGVWIAAPGITGLVIFWRFLGLLQLLELTVLDRFFIWRPREPVDDRIVIVDITEADIRKLGRWPLSDVQLTQLLANIKAQQPRVIGLDLYRDLQIPPSYEELVEQFKRKPKLLEVEKPVEPGYQALINLFKTTPNLIGIRKVTKDENVEAVSPPPGLKYPDQVGANDLPLDQDGKIRRFYLNVPVTKDAALNENDTGLDGFGVKLALKYLEAENIFPEVLDAQQFKYKLGQAVLVPFKGNDGGYSHENDAGYQLLINYRGSAKSFRRINITEVLANQIPAGLMRDRIIFIGASALSLNDLYYSPYSNALFQNPERMSGVEIHANITSQLLSAAISGRPMIKSWNEPLEWLWILGWSVIGAALTWMQRDTGTGMKRSLLLIATLILAGSSLIVSSYFAFWGGWWIPVVPPFLAMNGSAIAITAYVAKTAGNIRKTFGRYLTDDVVSTLLENPEGAKLGGERRTITIFTSDLRGFTATAERLPPEEVVKILNIYLGYMADIITEYKGTIDEFMGDGILVLFGAPTAREDDAERAVACAIAMQLAMIPVNEEMKKLGLSPLKMGIGINTGEVVVGNIGSTKRTKYGVVGSQVNLTYRIESYTTEGQILISQSTLEAAGKNLKIDGEKQVQPKGVKEPITIYDIGGIGEPYNLFLTKEEEVFFPIAEKIPLQYAILDGKHVSDTLLKGYLVEISTKGGKVITENPLAALTNIKLNFLSPENSDNFSEDIYAKVLEKQSDNGSFYIYFTAMPPDVEKMLDTLYKSCASGK